MARLFNGTSDQLATTVTTPMNVGFGTFVWIGRCTSFATTTKAPMRFTSSIGTNLLGAFIDTTGHVGMSNAAVAPVSPTALVAGEWYCIAVGKATGTTTPRVHQYRYSANTMVHENTGSTAADATLPTTAGFLFLGSRFSDQFYPGDLALCAFFARNLSDAEFELLPFSLANLIAASPACLLLLDQADTAQGVPDLTGNGAVMGLVTGTTVSSVAVPIFTYSDGPWRVIRPQAAGGAAEAAAGTTAGASTVTGALTSTVPITATTAGTATATAAARATVTLAGTAGGTSSAAGALRSTVPLAGTSAGTASATGTIAGQGQESAVGQSAGTSTVTGALSAVVPIAASSAGTATVTGAASIAAGVAGSSAGTSSLVAMLRASVVIAGTATGASTTAGALTGGAVVLPATRAAAFDLAYTGASASDAAYVGAGAGDLALAGAVGSDSEV